MTVHRRRRVLTDLKKIDADELVLLKKRTDIATAVIIIFIAILVARLWFLQIHQGDTYITLADNNRVRMLDIIAPRGNILDQQGRLIVANRPSFNVVWVKEDSPDPDALLKRLAEILQVDIAELLERIRAATYNPRHFPILLKNDIDWQTLVYLENNYYELPGIRVEILPRRNYQYGNLASHLIGYLGEINQSELDAKKWQNYQPGELIGKIGFEKLFENILRGEKGREYMEVNAFGFEQRRLKVQEPLPGDDIQLTLDLDLQIAAENALANEAGAVVAMEANTGRILALASSPDLNLDDFVGGISHDKWQALLDNPRRPLVQKPVQGQYPPGSTYKMITAAAGLSEGVITPNTEFFCTGSLAFGNRKYGCWKKGGHGQTDLHKALAQSCDVYFYQVGLRLGVDKLAEYATGLGLGQKTGIDFENEKSGLVPTSEWKLKAKGVKWQEGETLSIAIGQGFNLVTPLQLCQTTAIVANGGTIYQPQLIEKIYNPDGSVQRQFAPILLGKSPASEKVLALVRDGLVGAVNDRHGTARAAILEGITVGGKTGTAQVVRLEKYKDVKDEDIPFQYKDHAWFTSFAPAENPEIVVTVLMEHGGHGGSAAAPVAKKVLSRYFELQTKADRPADGTVEELTAAPAPEAPKN